MTFKVLWCLKWDLGTKKGLRNKEWSLVKRNAPFTIVIHAP